MLIYIDNEPRIIVAKALNPYGFIRVLDAVVNKYVATLPAKFIRDRRGSLTYNGHTYRWPTEKTQAIFTNGAIHIAGPHSYAYYYAKGDTWRESASISNDKLKELIKQSNLEKAR